MYLCPLDNSTCATYAAITELEAPPPVVQQASAPLRLGIESWPAAHWLVSLSTSAVVAQISIPCNRVRQCLLSLCLVLKGYRAPGTPRAPSTQTACCGQPPRVYCMFCCIYNHNYKSMSPSREWRRISATSGWPHCLQFAGGSSTCSLSGSSGCSICTYTSLHPSV